MAAGFLTQDQLEQQLQHTVENAAKGVSDFYLELGPKFGRALFFACMNVWGSAPIVTTARLNNNVRSHIIDACKYKQDLASVFLKDTGLSSMPYIYKRPASHSN